MTEIVTLKFRRGTTTEWAQSINKLTAGEPGFDLTTGELKIGDGIRAWRDLPVFSPQSSSKEYAPLSLGYLAGTGTNGSISIGSYAGQTSQKTSAIAIGSNAGQTTQEIGAISLGTGAGQTNQGTHSIAIGTGAGRTNQANNTIVLNASGVNLNTDHASSFYAAPVRGATASNVLFYNTGTKEISYGTAPTGGGGFNADVDTIRIGTQAGSTGQGASAVAVGAEAGNMRQGASAVAIGSAAARNSQSQYAVAVGADAGYTGQQESAIAIGKSAGRDSQGQHAVAIGIEAGITGQQENAIAIGYDAGRTSQGQNSVAIGYLGGYTGQADNTIILNATGNELNGVFGRTGCCYAAPIRDEMSSEGLVFLMYNRITKEIVAVPSPGPL